MSMTPRRIATLIGFGRLAFGLAMIVRPAAIGRSWLGGDAEGQGGQVAVRAIGARDAALGLGLLMALRRGRPLRGWVDAGMLADIGDALATTAAFGALPLPGKAVTLALAGGSALMGARIAHDVDAEPAAAA
jgi:hypothetical protein